MRKIIVCILVIMLGFVIAPENYVRAGDIVISINSGQVVSEGVSFMVSAPYTHINQNDKFTIDFGDMIIIKGCSLKFDITLNGYPLIFWGFDDYLGGRKATFSSPVTAEGFTVQVKGYGDGKLRMYYDTWGNHEIGFTFNDATAIKDFLVYHYDLSGCYIYLQDKGTSRDTVYHFYIPIAVQGQFIFDDSCDDLKVKFDTSVNKTIDLKIKNSTLEGEHKIEIQPMAGDNVLFWQNDDFPREIKFTLMHKDVFTKQSAEGIRGKNGYYVEYPSLSFTTMEDAYIKWGYTKDLENILDKNPVIMKKSPIYYQGFNQFGSIESIQKIDLKIDADEIKMDISVPEYSRNSYLTVVFKVNTTNVNKYYSMDGNAKQRTYGDSMSIYLKSEGNHSINFYVETIGGRMFSETRQVVYDKTSSVVKIDIPEATINDSVSLTFKSNEEVTVKEFETEGNVIKNVPAGKKVMITFIDKAGNETKQTVFVNKVMMVTMIINSVSYTVNGEVKVMDVAPFIKDNRTFVPIRTISETFGAAVSWDNGLITISKGDKIITFKVGDTEAKVGYSTVKFDSPSFIKDGRTFVPVRFMAEAFGFEVKWDNGIITIKEAV